jgi:hypothetical protein
MTLGDDHLQSCERVRLALESFEPERDQHNFVRDYGIGNVISLSTAGTPRNPLQPP